jgi:hypothetical protein
VVGKTAIAVIPSRRGVVPPGTRSSFRVSTTTMRRHAVPLSAQRCGLLVGLSSLAACASPATDDAPRWIRQVTFEATRRMLRSESDFPGTEDQDGFGATLDLRRSDGPLGFELGLNHTDEEDSLPGGGTFEARVTELLIGARGTWELGRFRPYLGGGLSLLYTELDFEPAGLPHDSDDDLDGGAYVRLGAGWVLGERLLVSAEYRRLFEELGDYGGFDLDYDQLTLGVGFSF